MASIKNVVGSGTPTGSITIQQYNTFADLPGTAPVDTLAYVRTTTGIFLINRNKRGVYRYTGSVWEFAGDSIQSSANTSYDNTTSGLTAQTSQAAIDELDGRVDLNDAKVSADGSVDTHSDVDTTTTPPNVGEVLEWNGTNWVPAINFATDTFSITAGRGNANTTDIWLRQPDNLATNLSPYVMPFDATIVAITAAGNANETWDGEVYRNTDVRTGGIPTDGNKLTEIQVSAADSATVVVNVDVDAGDEIGIFMRGSSIDRPSVTVYFVRR